MNIALIVAAGKGSRMVNASLPKQFIEVNHQPLIIYSLKTFNMHEEIDKIVIVTNKDYIDLLSKWCKDYKLDKVVNIIEGGKERNESVFLGLSKIKEFAKDDDIVLIHDAARPLVSSKIISDNIAGVKEHDAVVTAINVVDTILKGQDEIVDSIIDRKFLYQAQTPQSFRFKLIYESHLKARKENLSGVTDDTKVVMANNHDVRIVIGDKNNFKITTDDDLILLEALLKIRE